jgi:uncharacterized protein (TIGR00730 family)
MQRICVYCGSSSGNSSAYTDAATALGRQLASQGIGVIYGGASIGVMGALADATLARDGEVIGVIPRSLMDAEVGHQGLTDLHVVETMHERKALMAELADGFIAMPGGLGTLEELFEMLTWAQLGFHDKPIVALNTADYYAPLLDFLDEAVTSGFIRPAYRALLQAADSPAQALDLLTRGATRAVS